jgi:small subunit ribosomal protein S16
MLVIRMQRIGRINEPHFRVVVTEHTNAAKRGRYVELVGTHNPKLKKTELKAERIKYWISVGAQPSDTMHNMLVSKGIVKGKKVNVLPKKSVPVKEEKKA